jgi:uncharacterized membrane protein YgcG
MVGVFVSTSLTPVLVEVEVVVRVLFRMASQSPHIFTDKEAIQVKVEATVEEEEVKAVMVAEEATKVVEATVAVRQSFTRHNIQFTHNCSSGYGGGGQQYGGGPGGFQGGGGYGGGYGAPGYGGQPGY